MHARRPAHSADSAPPQVFRLVIRDRFGSKEDHPSLKVLNRTRPPGRIPWVIPPRPQVYARRNKRSARSPRDAGGRLLRFVYAEAGLCAHLLRIARALASGTASVTVPGSIDVRCASDGRAPATRAALAPAGQTGLCRLEVL